MIPIFLIVLSAVCFAISILMLGAVLYNDVRQSRRTRSHSETTYMLARIRKLEAALRSLGVFEDGGMCWCYPNYDGIKHTEKCKGVRAIFDEGGHARTH